MRRDTPQGGLLVTVDEMQVAAGPDLAAVFLDLDETVGRIESALVRVARAPKRPLRAEWS